VFEPRNDDVEILDNDRPHEEDVDTDQPDGSADGDLPAHLQGKSAQEVARYFQGRLDSEREARQELTESLQGGGRRQRREPEPQPEPEAEEEDEFNLADLKDIDPVDVLSEEGWEGLFKVLKKAGVTTGAGVNKAIKKEFGQLEQAYSLHNEFPELADQNSKFAQTTASNLAQINRDPDYKNLPPAKKYRIAATQAQAQLGTAKPARKPARSATDEYEDEGFQMIGEEEERQRRIERQAGPRGQGRRRGGEQDNNEELSPMQLRICKQLGVDPKNYAKRAKAGVTVHRRR
jgi:hypothetical protein